MNYYRPGYCFGEHESWGYKKRYITMIYIWMYAKKTKYLSLRPCLIAFRYVSLKLPTSICKKYSLIDEKKNNIGVMLSSGYDCQYTCECAWTEFCYPNHLPLQNRKCAYMARVIQIAFFLSSSFSPYHCCYCWFWCCSCCSFSLPYDHHHFQPNVISVAPATTENCILFIFCLF